MGIPLLRQEELRISDSEVEFLQDAAKRSGCLSVSEWVHTLSSEPQGHNKEAGVRDEQRHSQPASLSNSSVQRTVLENGIRIITEEIPNVRSLSLGVLVDCGSVDDGPGKAGLAHLCEHLLFQGTSSRDARHIARQIDAAGGQIGAFTSRDYTCFYASVLSAYSFHALDLLGDIFLNSTFPEESLTREKRAVANELESGSDIPSKHVHDLLKKQAWPDDPIGLPVIGDLESIDGITRDDIIYFVHRNYEPNRLVIAAAGDVRHGDFVAQVRDSFWRCVGEREARPQCPPSFHGGYSAEEIGTSMSYFAFGLEAPPYASNQRFMTHLLSVVLGEGMSARLFHILREGMGIVYNVQSEYHAYRQTGALMIEGSTAPESLEQVCVEIKGALRRLADWTEPVTDEELARAKSYLSAQYIMSSENVHTRMSRLATQELYLLQPAGPERILGEIDGVDVPSLHKFIREWVGPRLSNMRIVTAGPGEPVTCFKGDDQRRLTVSPKLSLEGKPG